MKRFLLLASVLILAGCGDGSFRYPCQDPHNWDKEFCKKPFCTANGTCPEDLQHYEKEKAKGAPQTNASTSTTGVCK